MANERRKFIRLDVRMNISYTIAGTKQLGKSLSKDVGGGGVRFIAEHPLEVGTRLEVTLQLDRSVRFVGEVVWTRVAMKSSSVGLGGTEVGVRFVEMTPQDLALMTQYASIYAPPSG